MKAEPGAEERNANDNKMQDVQSSLQQPTPPSHDVLLFGQPDKSFAPQQASPANPVKNEDQVASDIEQLTALTHNFVNMINNRDWIDEPSASSHVAQGFKAEYQQVGSLTMSQHTAIYRNLTIEYPEYHIELLTCNPEVEAAAGKATVFMDLQVTGAPPGVVRNSVTVTEWKLVGPGRNWTCFRMSTIRGRDLDGRVSMY